MGYDPDFEPLCLHDEDSFYADFYYHDLVTGLKKHYDDIFTLNIVGGGKTWKSMEYWNESKIYSVNPLCGATEEQKQQYDFAHRILHLGSDGHSAK